jgi:hypothetical protein
MENPNSCAILPLYSLQMEFNILTFSIPAPVNKQFLLFSYLSDNFAHPFAYIIPETI